MVQQQGLIVVTEAGNEKMDVLRMSVFVLCSMGKFLHNQYLIEREKKKKKKPEGISDQQKVDFHPDHQ